MFSIKAVYQPNAGFVTTREKKKAPSVYVLEFIGLDVKQLYVRACLNKLNNKSKLLDTFHYNYIKAIKTITILLPSCFNIKK